MVMLGNNKDVESPVAKKKQEKIPQVFCAKK